MYYLAFVILVLYGFVKLIIWIAKNLLNGFRAFCDALKGDEEPNINREQHSLVNQFDNHSKGENLDSFIQENYEANSVDDKTNLVHDDLSKHNARNIDNTSLSKSHDTEFVRESLKNALNVGQKDNSQFHYISTTRFVEVVGLEKPSDSDRAVTFISKQEIEGVKIGLPSENSLLSPEDNGLFEWSDRYSITRKEDINNWTSTNVKDSYRTIQQCFLRGEYYDLSSDAYSDYASVLMMDIIAALIISDVDASQCEVLFHALQTMCPYPDDVRRFFPKTSGLSKREFIVLKALILTLPPNCKLHAWSDIALHEMPISYKDYNLLARVQNVWLSHNLQDSPNIRQLLVTIFLDTLAQEFPNQKTSVYSYYRKTASNYYERCPIYVVILQIGLDLLFRFVKKDDLIVPLEGQNTKFQSVFENNFPDGLVKCMANSLLRHVPLSADTIQELYKLDNQIWKPQFEEIKGKYKSSKDYETFIQEADQLADWASKASNVYLLYAGIVREISKDHKTKALIYYFKARIINENTKIVKTSQQHLFPDSDYVSRFETILSQYKTGQITSNVAGERLLEFYPSEHYSRRKINISHENLQQKEQQFKKTVSLLGNIMNEEDFAIPAFLEVETRSTPVPTAHVREESSGCPYHSLFDAFKENNYQLSFDKVQAFAKLCNKMIGVLIDEINETYFELLDDNLIEENEDGYSIEPSYLQIIKYNE